MPLTFLTVPTLRFAQIRIQIENHGLKLLRYCGVSVVNVIIGVATLFVCLELFGINRVTSNVVAWAVSTVPAYLLSRYWVWEQTGSNSVKREVAPFWILGLIGLSLSTLCIWVAGFASESTFVLVGANFCAYGCVWVAKYLVLDRLMWRSNDGHKVDFEVA